MNYRNLGNTGLKVSELGLGCSSIGNSVFNYGSESEFLLVLNYAYDQGINFFDTADTYAFGNSETLIGKAFKNKRDRVIIASKAGFLPSSLSRHIKKIIPVLGNARKLIRPFKKKLNRISKKNQNFSPAHIRHSVEKSLVRLQTDYIDVYQLHNPPSEIISAGELFNLLDELKTEGKIRYYGVSASTIDDAVLCLEYPGISALQIEFNLLQKEAYSKLFPLLGKQQMGIIIKVPLARGLLTEKANEQKGFSDDNEMSARLNSKIKNLETEIGKKLLPESAIRFILEHREVSTVIAGTRSIKHLKENLKILSNPSLNTGELEKIFNYFSFEVKKSVI